MANDKITFDAPTLEQIKRLKRKEKLPIIDLKAMIMLFFVIPIGVVFAVLMPFPEPIKVAIMVGCFCWFGALVIFINLRNDNLLFERKLKHLNLDCEVIGIVYKKYFLYRSRNHPVGSIHKVLFIAPDTERFLITLTTMKLKRGDKVKISYDKSNPRYCEIKEQVK